MPLDPRTACHGCLRPLPTSSGPEGLCGACLTDPAALDGLIAAWLYQAPLSEAILALKFRRLDFLADALAELALGREPFAGRGPFDLIVPVPLAPLRQLERGFNQAERIARRLGSRLQLPVETALRRSGLLPSTQSRLGRSARRASRVDRYVARDAAGIENRSVLLVDDVVTTGTTLRAAAGALRAAGAATVVGFALAATPARNWSSGPP